MSESWIAIRNHAGLLSLERETCEAVQRALSYVGHKKAESFWAVLPIGDDWLIREALCAGHLKVALRLLQSHSTHAGPLIPGEPDSQYVTIPDRHDREWSY